MSRIIVIGINYAPENIGTGKYTSEMCEWLAARGHAVCVVTAPPYYPEWEVRASYRGQGYQRERRNGVDLIRCPIWVPKQPRGITRLLHLASFGLTSAGALSYLHGWKPEWIINIAPTLVSAPAALLLAKSTGACSWLHVQDFEVEAAIGMGIVRAGPLRRFVLNSERKLVRSFDVVSSISPKMVERLKWKGVREEQRVLFPNWADIDGIVPLQHPSPYRKELNIPENAVVALYSGNMGQKQGLELLGEAARGLADLSNLYFVFGGAGPARDALEQACLGLPNVRFLDLQPAERLGDWLGLADVHLLPQRADVADLVMPSKLTGMLSSGRPVLATASPNTGVAEAVNGRGLITPPDDIVAFTGALRRLATHSTERSIFGAAARAFAEESLSRDAILTGFESTILRTQND